MEWIHRSVSGRLWSRTALLLVFLVAAGPMSAGDLVRLDVTDSAGVYSIDVEMVVYAPAEDVWQVLTDYVHIYRLNPSIVESEILLSPYSEVDRIRTVINDCLFIFCIEVERVEDVRVTDAGLLLATVVGEMSNINSGSAIWSIRPAGNNSHITYQGMIDPGMAVFPVIGNYFARKKLRNMTLLTLENLERISRINAGLSTVPESRMVVSEVP